MLSLFGTGVPVGFFLRQDQSWFSVTKGNVGNMANMMTVPNQLRPRVLAADSTPMTTQLLVEALARDAQFQMIESPSDATALLAFVKKEQPRIAVISAKFGEL